MSQKENNKVKKQLVNKIQDLRKFKQKLLEFTIKSKEILERLDELEEIENSLKLI